MEQVSIRIPAIPGIEPELAQEWQYIRSSKGGGPGYWRRRSRREPSPAQVAQRLRLSELSHTLYGARGTTPTQDGRPIPANAWLIAPLLEGSPDTVPTGQPPIPAPITREQRERFLQYRSKSV